MALSSRKLMVTIGLEGDKVVIQRVKEVDAAVDKAGKNSTSFTSKLSAGLSSVTGPATAVLGAITAIGGAGLVAAGGLFELARSSSDSGSEIQDMIEKTGSGAETLSALRYGASTTDASFEDLGTGITRFSKTVAEANRGNDEARAKLIRLGVDPQAAINDLDGALTKAFKTINEAPPGIRQTAAATDAFGKSGANLIGVVKAADGDIAGLIKRGKELGVVMSDQDARAADEFGDTLATLQAQAAGTAFKFAKEFMPEITGAMRDISKGLSSNQDAATKWGIALANSIRGVRDIVREDGAEIAFWLRVINGIASFGASEVARYVAVKTATYVHDKGAESRAHDPAVYAANRRRNQELDAAAKGQRTLPGGDYDVTGGGRTGGKGSGESPLQKATKDLDARNSALEQAIELLKREENARRSGLPFLEADRLQVELQVKGYEKLAPAATAALIAKQQERDTLAANLQAARAMDQFWRDHDATVAKNAGTVNELNDAYKALVKTMGLRPNEGQERTIREAIGQDALDTELARQRDTLDQINGKVKTNVDLWDAVVKKVEGAGAIVDEQTDYWGRFHAFIVDSALYAERLKSALESMPVPEPAALPDDPNQLSLDQYMEQVFAGMGAAPTKPIDEWKTAFQGLEDIGVSAMESLANAIGSVVENWVLMGDAGGQSLAMLTATILAQVARQATVMAIMETAYGVAALTPWGAALYGPAAPHFKSAALFGLVAAGSAVAGRAVAGDKFNGKGGGAGAAPDYSQFGQQGYAGNQNIRANYDRPLPPSGGSETGRLADSVQYLAERIYGVRKGDVLMGGIAEKRGLIGETVDKELSNRTLANNVGRKLGFA